MEFIIDRSKWVCGGLDNEENKKGLLDAQMLNQKGFMCCLGHCAVQLGINQDDMLDKAFPEDVTNTINKPIKYLTVEKFNKGDKYYINSQLSNDAASINDDETIHLIERERRLKALFKEHGHTIKFVGKSVKPN